MTGHQPIRVLVVEDDDLTAAAHAEYVRRVSGFEVAGIAGTAAAAIAAVAQEHIDLVLLDMNLPDGHGIDVARRLRSSGAAVDIVAVTAVRDIDVVRAAVSLGIVQYLIKPFRFATFSDKLLAYAQYRSALDESPAGASQQQVDTLLGSLRSGSPIALPKGLSVATLDAVSALLRASGNSFSAVEVAEPLGMSRVTARRYLEHLAETGFATRSPRYGTPGRPELEYRWR